MYGFTHPFSFQLQYLSRCLPHDSGFHTNGTSMLQATYHPASLPVPSLDCSPVGTTFAVAACDRRGVSPAPALTSLLDGVAGATHVTAHVVSYTWPYQGCYRTRMMA